MKIAFVDYTPEYKNICQKSSADSIINYGFNNSISYPDFTLTNLSYPKNYYLSSFNPLSFQGKLTNKDIISKIGEENFPSKTILDRFKEEDKEKKEEDKSLYEIHTEYYKDLSDCRTLDEAKELYPEFSDVIDAEDIPEDKLKGILKKIKQGKRTPNTLNNFSLELLEKYYAQVESTQKKENYFDISRDALFSLFADLNIPRLNTNYIKFLVASNPEYRQTLSGIMKEQWSDPELRQAQSERSKEYWSDPESRQMQSDKMKEWYETEDGQKFRQIQSEAQSERSKEYWSDPESRQMQSERIKEAYSDPELRQAQSERAKEQWKDPEYRQTISDKMKEAYSDPELRQAQSERAKEQWKDPEYRQTISDKMKEVWSDPELRQAQSERIKEVWSDPEYRQARSDMMKEWYETENGQKLKKAQSSAYDMHPEIREKMKEIAKKDYPTLGIIIEHIEQGTATDEEKAIYGSYFKQCEAAMPGYHSVIGEETSRIYKELKEEEEE